MRKFAVLTVLAFILGMFTASVAMAQAKPAKPAAKSAV
jgi:hypothetical protein